MASPMSPTSLLWGHQLKREHTHLLTRVQTLESSSTALSTRLTAATATADRVTRLTADAQNLTARVSAIEEDDKDVKEWIEQLDAERQARMREESEKVERLGRRVGELISRGVEGDRERRRDGERLGELGRRVQELERGIKGEGLRRKNDPDDVKVLTRRLDAVEARRGDSQRKAVDLAKRMESLERELREFGRKNGWLEREVEKLRRELEGRSVDRVPDSERTTVVDVDKISSSTQGRAATIMDTVERSSSANGTQLQNSPTFSASLRRSVRIAPRHNKESFQPAQIVDRPSLERFGTALMEKQPGAANSRKKRRAAPIQDASRKKSKAKSKAKLFKEKLIAIKAPAQRPVIEPTSTISEPLTTDSTAPERPRKRKRREIPQAVDLETFAAMAGI